MMPKGGSLIFISVAEAFFTYMKVAFIAGIIVTSPFILYQIWAFVAPGLYQKEKRYLCYIFQPLLCSVIFDEQIEYLQVTEEIDFITKG
jgi:Sec-independent protein secretion pathway component TatC